jgi:hypothetical protein
MRDPSARSASLGMTRVGAERNAAGTAASTEDAPVAAAPSLFELLDVSEEGRQLRLKRTE